MKPGEVVQAQTIVVLWKEAPHQGGHSNREFEQVGVAADFEIVASSFLEITSQLVKLEKFTNKLR